MTTRYPNAGVRRLPTSFSKVQALRVVEVTTHIVERVKEAITRRCG
jgi:hypothetical protein